MRQIIITLDAQEGPYSVVNVWNDARVVQHLQRLYQPPRALRGHVYDGQPRPIGEYFPKVTI